MIRRQATVDVRMEGDHIVLLADLVDEIDGKAHRVGAGFSSDGASIPRVFSWLFPRWNEARLRAAIHHDYDYSTRQVTRKQADRLFLARMVADRNAMWRALAMYWALRGFGWIAWASGQRKRATDARTGDVRNE